MQYTQKKNKSIHTYYFEETGLRYSIKDEQIKKSVLIPYENITNQWHEFFESNLSFRNYAIYTGVVGVIFLTINILYGAKLWAWLFLIASPTFYVLYSKSKTAYKVINVENDIDIFIINDKQSSTIENLILEKRNEYLKRVYGQINYENDPEKEIGKFRWLTSLGIFSDREFNIISESIESV